MNRISIFLVFFMIVTNPAFSWAKSRKKTLSKGELIVQNLVREIRSSKKIGEWLNRGSKKQRLFFRKHFSRNLKTKFPAVVAIDSRLMILREGSKKRPHVLEFNSNAQGMRIKLNGHDISKKSKESLEQWYVRIFKRPKTALSDFLIGRAYAGYSGPSFEGFGIAGLESYYTSMIAAKGAKWADLPLNKLEKIDREDIVYSAQQMKSEYGLVCSKTEPGTAFFDFAPFDGENGKLRITALYDHDDKLARIYINRGAHRPNDVKIDQGRLGRIAYHVDDGRASGPSYHSNTAQQKDTGKDYKAKHPDGLYSKSALQALNQIINYYPRNVQTTAVDDLLDMYEHEMVGLETLSDYARACCGNNACRTKAELNSVESDPAAAQ